MSVSSQTMHHYVIAHITLNPLTLTLQSPVCFRNSTNQTLLYSLQTNDLIKETKKTINFSIPPNSLRFIPFYMSCCSYSMSIRCDLPSILFSQPISIDSIPFQQNSAESAVFKCPPNLVLQTSGDWHEWFGCCEVRVKKNE